MYKFTHTPVTDSVQKCNIYSSIIAELDIDEQSFANN